MNRTEIEIMARQSDADQVQPGLWAFCIEDLEAFAKLVADHTYAEYLEQPTPNQSGVISVTMPEPVAYLCENAAGHRYFRWKKPSSVYKPIALYTKDQA